MDDVNMQKVVLLLRTARTAQLPSAADRLAASETAFDLDVYTAALSGAHGIDKSELLDALRASVGG